MKSIQYFLPQRLSSWMFRKVTRIEAVWFKNCLIKGFCKIYDISLEECEQQNIDHFKSFNDFFTRALKKEARPISEAICAMPSDGRILALGKLNNTQFLEAKGHHFSLDALLADTHLANEFKNGQFATIYLSPSNYHRIHAPITGKLLQTIHIPGKLFSVSFKTAEQIPDLFAQNERLVCVFETEIGKVITILVGAINVSSIETTWHGPYQSPSVLNYESTPDRLQVEKGEEIGRFNMGSTVIVLLPESDLNLSQNLQVGQCVRMGETLALFS